MTRWEKAVVAAWWVLCGEAALILLLAGIQAAENAVNGRRRP